MNHNMDIIIWTFSSIKEIVCNDRNVSGLHKEKILAVVRDNASNAINNTQKLNQNEGDQDDLDFSRAT